MSECSLLNPLRLSGEGFADFTTMQTLDRLRYRAMRTVMGLHIESSTAAVLNSAAYYLTKIHRILPLPWQKSLTNYGTEQTVSFRDQSVFSRTIEHLGAEVVCEVLAGGRSTGGKEFRIRPIPRIKITPNTPQSVDWFTALAFRLENFFSLMLGTSVEIRRVQLYRGNEDGWVIQKVNGKKEKIDLQTRVNCNFEDTANALDRWLAVPQEDQLIELALLGALRKSDLYAETEFLTLTQALEGFGRIHFGGAKRREAKFDDLIQHTYRLFSPETAHRIVGAPDAFTSKIIQTRDYYTHLGNPRGSSAAKTLKELFLLNKRMHAFLRGAMLIKLGIREADFSHAIEYQATKWR